MVPLPVPSDLDRRLAALRESVADALPPPATDHAIAAAVARAARRTPQPGPRRATGDRWLAWPLALAASIAALSFVVRSLPPEAVVAEPAAAPASAAAEFMPVVPLADIERAGDTVVVPARLPRMTLAQLGLPVNPARAADAIDTELLVRRDGSVLAVRFIY
ncbi:MAG: hypothetical protein U1F58_12925 [Burkholderiales bacterium]